MDLTDTPRSFYLETRLMELSYSFAGNCDRRGFLRRWIGNMEDHVIKSLCAEDDATLSDLILDRWEFICSPLSGLERDNSLTPIWYKWSRRRLDILLGRIEVRRARKKVK